LPGFAASSNGTLGTLWFRRVVDPGLGLGARKLASGVLTVVRPAQDAKDTALGPFDLDLVAKHPELEWTAPDFPDGQPNFASPAETLLSQSRDVTFRHPVWGLEFAFKPARLIDVDIPSASGKMERKTVWYLLYRVRYTGDDLGARSCRFLGLGNRSRASPVASCSSPSASCLASLC
jgi:hypothetical protein